jgi:hypothetical protein
METYKCLAVSNSHLPEDKMKILSTLSGNGLIMARDTGVFVKLTEELDANLRSEIGEEFNTIVKFAHSKGFRLIEFDRDAEELDGFKAFEW